MLTFKIEKLKRKGVSFFGKSLDVFPLQLDILEDKIIQSHFELILKRLETLNQLKKYKDDDLDKIIKIKNLIKDLK